MLHMPIDMHQQNRNLRLASLFRQSDSSCIYIYIFLFYFSRHFSSSLLDYSITGFLLAVLYCAVSEAKEEKDHEGYARALSANKNSRGRENRGSRSANDDVWMRTIDIVIKAKDEEKETPSRREKKTETRTRTTTKKKKRKIGIIT